MLGRNLASLTLLAGVSLSSAGCFLFPQGVPTPVFEDDDVRMETPASGFRTLGEKGEVMAMADEVSTDVNRWVAEMAVGFGAMLEELNAHPPTEEDGEWRVYGPENGDDGDDDASWMARVAGDEDEARFEVLVGPRGAKESEMTMVFTGQLEVSEDTRAGGFTIDFDAIRKLGVIADDIEDGEDFGGKISVDFSRVVGEQNKHIDISFDEFWYVSEPQDEDVNYKDERYAYHREADGSGLFHFATWAPFEDEGWSGPEYERVTVDMAWSGEQAGRARAQVLEVEGEGDLHHGTLRLHECFDPGYALTWAFLNEPYAAEYPEYNEGDESKCLVEESALEAYEQ